MNWTGDNIGNLGGDMWTYPQVHEYYHSYYPVFYPNTIFEKSKVDLAFQILKVLQEKGIINITKVKTFVEVVDLIRQEL